MQRKIGWTVFLSLSMCSSLCFTDEISDGHWDLLTDFVYMQRFHIKDRTLAFDPTICDNDCPERIQLSTKQLAQGFDFEPGLHVALSYVQNPTASYEGGFLYVWESESSTTRKSSSSSLVGPFQDSSFAEDFYLASEMQAVYKSQFYTAELNFWKAFGTTRRSFISLSGVGGIRYGHVNESFSLIAIKGAESGNYDISTKNDLIGVQIGFLLEFNVVKNFHWDLEGKAGVGLNRMSSNSFLAGQNKSVELRKFNKQDFQSAIFAEALAGAGYRVLPYMDIHAGYQMLYFCGLALAPDQVDTSSTTTEFNLYRDGYVIIHGIYAGLTFSF